VIHLQSIELACFKGVAELRCDFDSFTVLAGLNNSGKTTILQAVYLLISALRPIAENPNISNQNPEARRVSLQAALPPLGLRDTTWLYSQSQLDVSGRVTGVFSNELKIELGVIRNSPTELFFTVSHPINDISTAIGELKTLSAAILTPPGDVPTRERMVNGDQYQNDLREGKGAQLWRNGLWWAIQRDGPEAFAPVQKQIRNYFPDVELLIPTLSSEGLPEILIKYKEGGRGPLDIAQSGAGLRTFISLARMLEQSPAKLLLLDEPDSHLHASQQAVILDLMLDAAASTHRQVIIASHSPEVITRVPAECIRWVDRDSNVARGGFEISQMLEQIGVSADVYSRPNLPDILIYVEGVNDKPIIEAIVKWCRHRSAVGLPTTLVIPHGSGRFEASTLMGIVRVARETRQAIRVVGVRDLDFYYAEIPGTDPAFEEGDGWSLLTLPCKELENLFCDHSFLFQAYNKSICEETLRRIIDEESGSKNLIDQWRYQVRPRVRDRLEKSLDSSTRERLAEEIFQNWQSDAVLRCRLVAGKGLLSQIRHRIRKEHKQTFYPVRILEQSDALTPSWMRIARSIFPSFCEADVKS
jgi:ABC-type transport system involved in cytochrome c biogenesis ATPase subunit